MELKGERLISASVERTWEALNDPDVLRGCIAGCESLERTADGFVAVVALKVGPVSARFKGSLKLTHVQPPTSYTINFDGQGGVAGFGKGSADVALQPQGAVTLLAYTARATVGGKMAQIGARLIDATAAKLTEDFFKAFDSQVSAAVVAEPADQAVFAGEARVAPKTLPPRLAAWWIAGAVVLLAGVLYLFAR